MSDIDQPSKPVRVAQVRDFKINNNLILCDFKISSKRFDMAVKNEELLELLLVYRL